MKLFSRVERRSSKLGRERGTAILEFALCLPFFVGMAVVAVDLAMMLNQYLLLTQAVHAGVRAASASSTLPSGTYQLLRTDPACAKVGSSVIVQDIQSKMKDLVRLNNSRVDLSTLCVQTMVRTGATWAGKPEQNTILVSLTVNYQSLFPLFPNVPISVQAAGPSLF